MGTRDGRWVVTLLLAGTFLLAAEDEEVVLRKDIFSRKTDGYHTYRIPTMVVTGKGTILVFVEGRKTHRRDHGDVDLLMKRSEDGGCTWSEQVLIHEEGGNALIRVGNPCPIVEKDGRTVHLLFTRNGPGCLFYTRSRDEGNSWEPFARVSDDPKAPEYRKGNFLADFGGSPVGVGAGPVHGIHTSKGRLIAPSYIGHKVDGEGRGQSCIIYSDDGGKSWQAGGVIPWVPEFRHGECTIVERRDGSLLMNMRTSAPGVYSFGYRLTSVSTDHGMTWSKPVVDRNLPCPACQASMIRLNGKGILFLNPAVNHHGGFSIWSRKKLTLRLSRDEGRSWEASRVLNEGLAGYSDLAIAKNGNILCLFENGERDYCEKITIAELKPSWLTRE
ncbi:MAG: sialidase family protein [Verrucomicrobiota bacterium]|nr:sialidase family protein [Verrucomicrobiota bacterium]